MEDYVAIQMAEKMVPWLESLSAVLLDCKRVERKVLVMVEWLVVQMDRSLVGCSVDLLGQLKAANLVPSSVVLMVELWDKPKVESLDLLTVVNSDPLTVVQ
jgi:hypothetical protein